MKRQIKEQFNENLTCSTSIKLPTYSITGRYNPSMGYPDRSAGDSDRHALTRGQVRRHRRRKQGGGRHGERQSRAYPLPP